MQAWVIGNWKQNPATNHDVNTLVDALLKATSKNNAAASEAAITPACQLMVAPSCIHLANVSDRLQGSSLLCAAQDISAHSHSTGAYTGDCSAQQVVDAGASWTLLGHSERRQYHQESNDTLVQKLDNALAQGLGVVLCVGETQVQYDDKQTLEVLGEQLSVIKALLAQSSNQEPEFAQMLAPHLIVAYEPVWAIGTGKVPTVAEVSATHDYIKQTVASFAAPLTNVSVLYGGSVNADNADDFAASPMIDGALVGGAALKADSFLAIAAAFTRAKA
ncbi:triose-phosphate isomerase [Psychrobacter frigidicola]|uniref:Triosephosphate isomerase n=1 Tax=Psychrobacter frigidicola TaxID=45611 RepID=A0A5C7A2C4_9GAMM|nr:triose-phosphate isomerase [Psychrobacter frigidicola]TXD96832.1 triose-phosphate isomerase [Psychrobacter frigidicola]